MTEKALGSVAEGRVHACTVNGQDAQHWYDEAERWKKRAGEEYLRGREASDRLWAKVTGFIDRRAYMNASAPSSAPLPLGSGGQSEDQDKRHD